MELIFGGHHDLAAIKPKSALFVGNHPGPVGRQDHTSASGRSGFCPHLQCCERMFPLSLAPERLDCKVGNSLIDFTQVCSH